MIMNGSAFRGLSRLTPALCLAVAGCDGGLSWSGEEGQAAKARLVRDVLFVDATLDGSDRLPLVADTGSPIVVLSPEGYDTSSGVTTMSGLRIGGLTFSDLDVVGADLVTSPDPATPIGGLLGCTVLCEFATTFDYRGEQLFLGGSPSLESVEPSIDVPFQLEGGGDILLPGSSEPVTMPPSRITLTATLEGTERRFVVDTGASTVVLRRGIYDALAADGRAQLATVAQTIQGPSPVSTMRLRSVTVGGAEVHAAPACADEATDKLLDSVEAEIGGPVDGLIGGSFLREFLVTIDYPARQLVLRRYTTRDHVVDMFLRVGVSLAAPDAESRVRVRAVLPGSDAAAKGVTVGDEVTAIDGQPVGALSRPEADALLTGEFGAKRELTFGAAASPSLDHQTIPVAVDDLLPLP